MTMGSSEGSSCRLSASSIYWWVIICPLFFARPCRRRSVSWRNIHQLSRRILKLRNNLHNGLGHRPISGEPGYVIIIINSALHGRYKGFHGWIYSEWRHDKTRRMLVWMDIILRCYTVSQHTMCVISFLLLRAHSNS